MTRPGYTRTAIALHWLVALIILGSFPLGLYMVEMTLSPTKLKLYSYHKWAGVTVFALALARLAWRTRHRPPPVPAAMRVWEQRLAGTMHGLLYFLLLALPLTGWLMSSALGFQTVYFGVLPIPDLLAKNKPLGEALEIVHAVLAYAIGALVLLHAAAALKHHLFDRDEVLARMLPFLAKRENNS